MRITDITPQRRHDRVNIYIDEKFAFGLSLELQIKYDLYKDREVSQDFIDNVVKAEEQNKVLNSAFNILSYGQKSSQEIYTKLMRKGYEEEYVLKAIDYCKDRNYLNDKNYAENFVKDKTNINKHGSVRIKYDLIAKGISRDIIDEVLNLEYEDEYSRAYELAKRRIKSYRNDDRNAIYRKLGGFLQRRGYTYDVVSRVLREVLGELY